MTAAATGSSARHAGARDRLLAQYAAIPTGEPVRLAKRTSNLFRPRAAVTRPGLDVADLDQVLSVDPVARTADVQGMTTYEHLVDATLAHGLMPTVVPQLKTITLGGAVTGLGIESSSFRGGLPHEAVREIEVLTGAGDVVTATPDGPDADLYRAFPNSYGTLGYALRLVVDLEPVRLYVHLRHVRFGSPAELTAGVGDILASGQWAGRPVDFLDGVVFSATESYLTLGSWVDSAPYTSDYTGRQIFYRSVRSRPEDYLTVRDYLWRWDTDWFWCSRAFGAQNPRIRRFWPRRWLRSDVYWKMIALENRYHVVARIEQAQGKPARERLVQDVEIPLEHTGDFLDWFLREVPVEPIWVCPLKLRPTGPAGTPRAGETPWPLYPLAAGAAYVNVGFWSTVPIRPGATDGDVNRTVERVVAEHGGHKSLYSDAYYDEKSFRELYGGPAYEAAKARYDPDGRLLDLYAKAVMRR